MPASMAAAVSSCRRQHMFSSAGEEALVEFLRR
jgi:hypothetical protein